jgi:hypothetical protein
VNTFREGAYVVDTTKGVHEVFGQLRIDGGVLAVIAPNGTLVQAWAAGAWRTVTPA